MAPKKTNKLPTGERPKQLSKMAENIRKTTATQTYKNGKMVNISASEAAGRAGAKRDKPGYKVLKPLAGAELKKFIKDRDEIRANEKARKAKSYSPTPMSPSAKSQTAMRAAKISMASSKRTARKPKAGSGVVSNVVGAAGKVASRAKTTAREARDVVTAVGTSARSRLNTRSYRSASGGLKSTPTSKANTAAADKNLKKQLKETVKAATTGKKGTTSAQTGGKPSKKR